MYKQNARAMAIIGFALSALILAGLWFSINSSASANGPSTSQSSASATTTATPSGQATTPTTGATSSAAASTPSATTPGVVHVTPTPCDVTGIKYFHNDDPATDNFGPRPDESQQDSLWKRFQAKFCPAKSVGDPSFTAIVITTKGTGVNATTATTAQSMAGKLAASLNDLTTNATAFMKHVVGYAVLVDNNPTYSTFNMSGNGNGQPTLTYTGNVNHPAGVVLVLVFDDGSKLTLRGDCDLQPIVDVPSTPGPTTAPTTGPTGTQPPPCTTCGGTTPPPCTNCNTGTTPPPCGSACNHTTPPPPPTTTPKSPPVIVDHTEIQSVEAGQSSKTYNVTVKIAPGDHGTVTVASKYGHMSNTSFSVGAGVTTVTMVYTAPNDVVPTGDTITITVYDDTTGQSARETANIPVIPVASRP